MRIPYILLALLLLSLSITACAQKRTRQTVTKPIVFQGICGTVVEKRGNHMPSPDAHGRSAGAVDSPRPNPVGAPVEREVLIFPVLNRNRVDAGDNGFIQSVRGVKPVKTVKSGKDGTFCVSLPVGQYSVVVQEPKGLYANLFDSQNNIFPVRVEKGKKAQATVEISHQAVF